MGFLDMFKKKNENIKQLTDGKQNELKQGEMIAFQIERSLREYDDWYTKEYYNDDKKSYKGPIDIVSLPNGENIVILNCIGSGQKEDKIVLAITKFPGESRIEQMNFLTKEMDDMISAMYNKKAVTNNIYDMKYYLQGKMDNIKSEIFDIEFTDEGEFILLNGNTNFLMTNRTVSILKEYDQDNNMAIKGYERNLNLLELPDDVYSNLGETTFTVTVKKLDLNQSPYQKEHYIYGLQKVGRIAETIGLIDDESSSRTSNSGDYDRALRDAIVFLKTSKYAGEIDSITSMNDIRKNDELIKECVRNVIGDIYVYYENIIDELTYKRNPYKNIMVDKKLISATIALGKTVQTKRMAEYTNIIQSSEILPADKKRLDELLSNSKERDDETINGNKSFADTIKVSRDELNLDKNQSIQENPQKEEDLEQSIDG